MSNQMKIEFYKLIHSVWFWGFTLFFIIIGFSCGYILTAHGISGYEAYFSCLNDTSLLFVFPIFASVFIGLDFSHRTVHNEIRIGMSRSSVIFSRSIIVFIASWVFHVSYALTTMITVGIGCEVTPLVIKTIMLGTLISLLHIAAIQSVAIFINFCTKKVFSGMAVSVCVAFVMNNILRNFSNGNSNVIMKVFKCTSSYQIMQDVRCFTTAQTLISIFIGALTIVLLMTASYLVFRKAELK